VLTEIRWAYTTPTLQMVTLQPISSIHIPQYSNHLSRLFDKICVLLLSVRW